MYCPNCGKQIPNTVNFCPYCGANIEEYLRRKEEIEKVKNAGQKAMSIEDVFGTVKTQDPEQKNLEEMKEDEEDFSESFEETRRILIPKDEPPVNETVFRLDEDLLKEREDMDRFEENLKAQATPEPESEAEELEPEQEDLIVEKLPFSVAFPRLHKLGAKLERGQNVVGKFYRKLLQFHGFLYKKLSLLVEKFQGSEKLFLALIALYAIVLVVPMMLFEAGLNSPNGRFSTLVMILLLTAFDGGGNFLIFTGSQILGKQAFHTKPSRNEIYKKALLVSVILALVRFVLFFLMGDLVIVDAILMARPLGAHPIIAVLLFIMGILLTVSFNWDSFESEEYPAVLGLSFAGGLLVSIILFLVGSTLFNMLIQGLAPHLIL